MHVDYVCTYYVIAMLLLLMMW